MGICWRHASASEVHGQASTEACQTSEWRASIRFNVILCRRLGSRNDLSSFFFFFFHFSFFYFLFSFFFFLFSLSFELLQEVTTMTNDEFKIQPQDGKDRIIFLSMHNDIDWNQKNNEEMCRRNSSRVSAYANDFPTGNWTFLGLGDE